jgi:hypothetical protein
MARESKAFLPVLWQARPPSIATATISILVLVTAIGGLAEPVGDVKMDAIAYHFLGPHVWIRDAAIHPLPDECHASFPANVETVFAGLMFIGGTRAPEFFALFAYGLLLLVAAGLPLRPGAGFFRRVVDRGAGWHHARRLPWRVWWIQRRTSRWLPSPRIAACSRGTRDARVCAAGSLCRTGDGNKIHRRHHVLADSRGGQNPQISTIVLSAGICSFP